MENEEGDILTNVVPPSNQVVSRTDRVYIYVDVWLCMGVDGIYFQLNYKNKSCITYES